MGPACGQDGSLHRRYPLFLKSQLKFLSLLAALLLEQMRPVRAGNPVHASFDRYAAMLERQLNSGERHHGVLAWMLAVVPLALVTIAVYYALFAVNPLLAWLWNIAVLYLTMGFRQFSHYFTEIIRGLREANVESARAYLASWRGASASEFTAAEVARVSIELALVGSHRHVFGPVAAFIVLGAAGPVVYRASAMLAERWGARTGDEFGDFGTFSRQAFFWLDWLPARLTAASFAIVGNFEDAVYCWRTQAMSWTARANGVILASGGGALGVRLGDALHETGHVEFRPELGTGDEADLDYMQSAVGLLWRALVLWLFLIFVVTVAHSLG
jgi:adenosylcobinamide-phosphate synthase